MSKNLFAHAASRSGLRVLEQVTMDWDEARNLDCLTLVEKASDGSPGMEKPKARSESSPLTRLADRVKFIFLK